MIKEKNTILNITFLICIYIFFNNCISFERTSKVIRINNSLLTVFHIADTKYEAIEANKKLASKLMSSYEIIKNSCTQGYRSSYSNIVYNITEDSFTNWSCAMKIKGILREK